MGANEVHLNDVGTVFEVTLKDGDDIVDISTASTLQIIFKSPTKRQPKTAVLSGTGTDGKLKYTTVSGDLFEIGDWELQVYVVIPASGEWRSDVGKFEVYDNL